MDAVVRARLMKRGFVLEYATLGWNVIGVCVILVAAGMARSVALAGFGLDSLIEISHRSSFSGNYPAWTNVANGVRCA